MSVKAENESGGGLRSNLPTNVFRRFIVLLVIMLLAGLTLVQIHDEPLILPLSLLVGISVLRFSNELHMRASIKKIEQTVSSSSTKEPEDEVD